MVDCAEMRELEQTITVKKRLPKKGQSESKSFARAF